MTESNRDNEVPPVNLSRISEDFTKDIALQKKLYQVYMDDMSDRLIALESAVECLDFPAIQRVAHSIKGTSANIGVPGMQSLALQTETIAEAQRSDEVQPKAKELETEYAAVCDFLHKFIADH